MSPRPFGTAIYFCIVIRLTVFPLPLLWISLYIPPGPVRTAIYLSIATLVNIIVYSARAFRDSDFFFCCPSCEYYGIFCHGLSEQSISPLSPMWTWLHILPGPGGIYNDIHKSGNGKIDSCSDRPWWNIQWYLRGRQWKDRSLFWQALVEYTMMFTRKTMER